MKNINILIKFYPLFRHLEDPIDPFLKILNNLLSQILDSCLLNYSCVDRYSGITTHVISNC